MYLLLVFYIDIDKIRLYYSMFTIDLVFIYLIIYFIVLI